MINSIRQERNGAADLLKGIAVILMIQVHLVELFARQDFFDSSIGSFLLFLGGPPAAPVFMAAMGYFVFKSNKPTGYLVLRGLKLIGGGILLNIGLNLNLLISIYSNNLNINPFEYIFGADILPLAGFSIIILALLKSRFKDNFYLFAVLGIIVLIVTPLLPDIYSDNNSPAAYFQAFFWGNLSWSYFPLFPWLFYPAAGYTFAAAQNNIRNIFSNKIILYPVAAAAFLIIAVTWGYGYNISSTLEIYYHHNFMFAIWTLIFISLYSGIIFFLHKTLPMLPVILYLKWVGKNVTAFYIFQWLIIGNIATEIYKTQYGIELILWFSAVMIAVTMLVLIYNNYKEKLPNHRLKKA
jgi:uncharacterized membrane protein